MIRTTPIAITSQVGLARLTYCNRQYSDDIAAQFVKQYKDDQNRNKKTLQYGTRYLELVKVGE